MKGVNCTTENNSTSTQVFSVYCSVFCKNAAQLTSFFTNRKILPNLVYSSSLWRIMCGILANQKRRNSLNEYYYSFKIFPQFWLAKSIRIIHHNQLLMTKFEGTLCLTRKWRQNCSPLQVNGPLTEKTWGRGSVVFVMKIKMADTSLVSRVRTTARTRRNNG